MATVSVIIPVWNAEEYLADAVRSVQSQTLSDWELLVVDDGSTDSSVAIAQEFAEHDARPKRRFLLESRLWGKEVNLSPERDSLTMKLPSIVPQSPCCVIIPLSWRDVRFS